MRTSDWAETNSLTVRPRPNGLKSLRNSALVTPAIGARANGGNIERAPMRSGCAECMQLDFSRSAVATPGPERLEMIERASVSIAVPAPLLREVIALRRDFHAHPELGFQETRTAGIVAGRLEALGYDVRTGV